MKATCDSLTCCDSWSALSRAFNAGRKLEAAKEAARCVRTGDGEDEVRT